MYETGSNKCSESFFVGNKACVKVKGVMSGLLYMPGLCSFTFEIQCIYDWSQRIMKGV